MEWAIWCCRSFERNVSSGDTSLIVGRESSIVTQLKRTALLGTWLVMIFGIACSSGKEEDIGPAVDFDSGDAFERSAAAMAALESYHMEFTFRPKGEPLTFVVDYADPADYYERFLGTPEVSETFELILYDGNTYGRQCDAYPDDCTQWQQSKEKLAVPGGFGLTTVAPETLGLTALAFADNPETMGAEDVEGTSLVHVRGSLRLGRTILENQRRVYGNVEDYWESCESTEIFPGDDQSPETCRTLSFEEYVEEEYSDVDFDLEPAAPVHIWLSPEDHIVHRLVIGHPGVPTDNLEPESIYFEVDLSLFNQASVTPPSDYVPES